MTEPTTDLQPWWDETPEEAERYSSWRDSGPRCHRCWELADSGDHMRYYCPGCGEVRCGVARHGETIVMPHFQKTATTTHTTKSVTCLGGPVDAKEDRAP